MEVKIDEVSLGFRVILGLYQDNGKEKGNYYGIFDGFEVHRFSTSRSSFGKRLQVYLLVYC